MKVKELIKFLKEQDKNAEVKVFQDDGCGCCSSGGEYVQLDIELVDGEIHFL